MQKHKHYNEIIAFAEGKEIQCRIPGDKYWNDQTEPTFNPKWEYRVKDPYRELKEAKAAGKTIEYNGSLSPDKPYWFEIPDPIWAESPGNYRIKLDKPKKDPYQELKDALRAGKTIQVNTGDRQWFDSPTAELAWDAPLACYRIKPEEQQPTCSQNQQAPEPVFAKSKVGDKVYSLTRGFGKITKIYSPGNQKAFPIEVMFENMQGPYGFTIEGKSVYCAITPDLYWDKPQIIAPKRMITVTEPVWFNTYDDDYHPDTRYYHKSEVTAEGAGKNRPGKKTIAATLTYQTEEK